ncbi:MAG TPA: STAS domain-containing protein [Actinomycetota bacterium]|nr:STAS domain-containing protein [Actinomycetota bacterium]
MVDLMIARSDDSKARHEPLDLASVWLDRQAKVFALRGEVDLSNAHAILEAVSSGRNGGGGDLVLDLAGLDFIDCSGLHVLATLATKMQRESAKLLLQFPRRIVLRAIEVSRLAEHPAITIVPGSSLPAADDSPEPHYVRLA